MSHNGRYDNLAILAKGALNFLSSGEWLNGRVAGSFGSFSQQPDFLWLPRGPLPNPMANGPQGMRDPKKNPHVSYTKVRALFERAQSPDAQ